MVITFTQERKKQRYLILVLALMIFSILLVVWWGFFIKEKAGPPLITTPSLVSQKVEISWQILKDPQLKELQLFEEILPFEDEVGRENPFIPY